MTNKQILDRAVLFAKDLGWAEHRLSDWTERLSKATREKNKEGIDICTDMLISINSEIVNDKEEIEKLKKLL